MKITAKIFESLKAGDVVWHTGAEKIGFVLVRYEDSGKSWVVQSFTDMPVVMRGDRTELFAFLHAYVSLHNLSCWRLERSPKQRDRLLSYMGSRCRELAVL